ncbi:VWA domain-containing protein [Candidatus Sumerlaeota bacterium]|nr:VWA domain-containing protein [Candidatus Sumerlaeota bacterium]
MIRFAEPVFLWLLLIIPLVWVASRRLRLIERGRRFTIIALRTLLLLLVILALAKLELRKSSRDLSVFYLLDVSESVPPDQQKKETEYLADLSKKRTSADQTGVIVFGERPSIETSTVKNYEFEGKLLSTVGGDRTDIASSLRLAMAAFPVDSMRRIVLMSDGNENFGSALEVARIAKNNGIPIDTIALTYESRNDVQLEKIVVPERTTKDAPFDIKVFVNAEQNTEATIRIFEDGNLILEEKRGVAAGRNPPFVMQHRLKEGGFHNYTATVEAAGDQRPQNNQANGFTYLKAEPRILFAEGGDLQSTAYMRSALQSENIIVDVIPPGQIPTAIETLQRYDSMILSNVPANEMSQAQMQMIERAVHDLGIGLIMIGGENAFGAGGYMDTPIETALPVSMDIKQKKVLPNGALVIVLHTCEIADGNAWAREISSASLNVLSAQDYFGIVYFGPTTSTSTKGGTNTTGWGGAGWGDNFLWDPGLQLVGDKKAMRTAIKGVQPSDMPTFDPTMKMAAEALIAVKAETKHMVIISDGDPQPPQKSVVNAIRNNGITVSTVGIFPHDPSTVATLEEMALWGGGNYYYPKTSKELPRIFTKEATVVRKSLIREQTFVPHTTAPSEVLMGISGFPQLDGYVVTSIKDLAIEALTTEWDDPLLAHWRYGLGKTVAFTSDAKDKWASKWVQWGSFAKFWSQTVRWSLRETNNSNFQVHTEVQGGVGKVTIDAVDEAGNFQNMINFDANVISPEFGAEKLHVQQVAPGRYEGTFPASKVGTYMLSMSTGQKDDKGNPQFLTSGVSLSYSPEYETSTSSETFLEKISQASGGVVVKDLASYNPYLRNLAPVRRPNVLWPWLLLAATLLLPVDIFLRRVYLNWMEIGGWIKEKLFGLIPSREKKEAYASRMEGLRAAKARATADKDAEKEERVAREAFRERLTQKETQGATGDSVFTKEDEGKKPVVRREKQTYTTDTGAVPPPKPGGMGSLMEAKKRAQQKTKKQGEQGNEEEKK